MNLMNQCMTYSPNVFLVMLNGELNMWLRPEDFQALDLKTGGAKKGRGVDREQVDLAPWWDCSTDHLFLVLKLHFAQEWIVGGCWLVPSCVSLGEVSTEDRKGLSLSTEIFLLRLDLHVYINVYFCAFASIVLILWIPIKSTKFGKGSWGLSMSPNLFSGTLEGFGMIVQEKTAPGM